VTVGIKCDKNKGMLRKRSLVHWLWSGVFLLAGCMAAEPATTPTPREMEVLNVSLLYPIESSKVEMGQTIKTIVRVTDERGHPVPDAGVTVIFSDPAGRKIGSAPAAYGDGEIYRSEAWTVPHRMQVGSWTVRVEASTSEGRGTGGGQLAVNFSTSEILYYKYGFWLDAPTLKGIQPSVTAERGDAENGLIRWGGAIPSQHIFPENWVEVHWRKGDFKLDSPESVRTFMLADVGDLGFTPVREIGAFKKTKFKHWDAWEAPARGQYAYYEMMLTVFYAPEVDKTYAIATTVVHPPSNIKPHEVLLENFDIDAGIQATGLAPAPLIPLLPQPKLISPELGAPYTGLEQPITLKWEPVKELVEDEYYQVAVDYNYKETNHLVKYATRETQFTLPEELYHLPNCTVFNWRITLMQQTDVDKKGNPVGQALSYSSLYWYVRWFYPPDETAPFAPHCPNAQF
jgi:hypothetical protein